MTPASAPSRRPLDLCDPGTARAVARRAGLSLKRRLGQHLLVDSSVVERIVDALAPSADDDVYEIGPGIGTLTVALAGRARQVVAAELDEACLRALAITLHGHPNATAVRADALHTDARTLGLGPDYLAAGNIPYGITGALLPRLLEVEKPPRRAVLLLQREVAARLAAGPGDWSLSTVAVRSLATIERLADVSPASFEPPPAVHSSIVRLVPATELAVPERAAVLELARGAFQVRRKVLRHGVGRAVGDEALALEALHDAGIDPTRRPGTLELDEWRKLARSADALGWRVHGSR